MKASVATSVDEYIASQPEAARRALRRVRAAIRRAIPEAEETLSYRMPAYRLCGRIALYFAGWSEHFAIYPAGGRFDGALERALAGYERGKGTIRFPLSEPVPVALIERIARFRAKQIREASRARQAG